jgi:hypothetical protein
MTIVTAESDTYGTIKEEKGEERKGRRDKDR